MYDPTLERDLVAAIQRNLEITMARNFGGIRDAVTGLGRDVTGLGREVSGMSAKLEGLCTTVREHSEAIHALQIADATGRVDVAEQRAMLTAKHTERQGLAWLPLIAKIAPWIMTALIGLGVYLGSGGDSAANANAIRYLVDTVRAMEADMDKIKLEDHLASPGPAGIALEE